MDVGVDMDVDMDVNVGVPYFEEHVREYVEIHRFSSDCSQC
jgi:hypothetical protein